MIFCLGPPEHVLITDSELVGFPYTNSLKDTCWIMHFYGAVGQQTLLFFWKTCGDCVMQTENVNLDQLRCTSSANLCEAILHIPINLSWLTNLISFYKVTHPADQWRPTDVIFLHFGKSSGTVSLRMLLDKMSSPQLGKHIL